MVHHGAGLRRLIEKKMEGVDAFIEALARDHRSVELSDEDRAMLDYALKLTRTPQEMTADDVELLRAYGFDDRAIHDICAIAGYYGFVNRMADGLGVELE